MSCLHCCSVGDLVIALSVVGRFPQSEILDKSVAEEPADLSFPSAKELRTQLAATSLESVTSAGWHPSLCPWMLFRVGCRALGRCSCRRGVVVASLVGLLSAWPCRRRQLVRQGVRLGPFPEEALWQCWVARTRSHLLLV